jgi:endoglucanase
MMSIKTGVFAKGVYLLVAVFFIIIISVFIMAGCIKKSPEAPAPVGFIVTHKYSTPEAPMPMKDITAAELVSGIYIGWNLGNTFDTADLSWLGRNPSVAQMETAWGNPVTTKENIIALRNAGFNALRIPVSWSKAVDSSFIIRTDWLERVVEIVNYAVDCDMYVILNTHHDEDIFKFTNARMEEAKTAFKTIWEQIAAVFVNYNEKLLFEALNEPRTKGSAKEWSGGTAEEHLNLNVYYQLFVDTVRASGGNNSKRMLMITPYAASGEAAAINALKMPVDLVENKIIVSIHVYSPYNFALNKSMSYKTWDRNKSGDTSPITTPLDRAYNAFVNKGIPVIWGEFGAMNKDNAEDRTQWADFYVSYAKGKGIPCIWWDNGVVTGDDAERFGLLDRQTNKIIYPDIVDALMNASGAVIGPPIEMSATPLPVIRLPVNQWSPGYQTQFNIDTYLGGKKITTGDEYTFKYSIKSNVDIVNLKIVLVDATEQANWWTELTKWVEIGNITANEQVSGTITFTAEKTATSTVSAANKLVFDAEQETESPPTLTFTAFSFEKK